MRYFQNHISRFTAFLIAFQILNMSIDSPSAQMQVSSGSTDNFNYIDTYVEFVAEVILKYDNAIPETQNRQQKELQMQKQFELVFQKIESVKLLFFTQQIEKRFISYSNKYAFQFIKEINPPPPKA
jgi:hypothetical protein